MSLVLQSFLPSPNSCLGTSQHQQTRDTKMATLSFGGIDVSKDRLDVLLLPRGMYFSVRNNAPGWTELVAAGLSVRGINPNKLRQFARACGVLAKNDRLDARLIAEYVAAMPTRVVRRDEALERLAEIVTMRRQLCDEHAAAMNQATHLEDPMLRRLSKRRLVRSEADICLLDKRLAELVAADPRLAHRYQLLISMPGVGPTLAHTLPATLPELGQIDRKQIAALVGLAPYDFDSGKLKGPRCIWGGHMRVRNFFYMPARSKSRYNPALKAFSNRLAAAGKKS